MNKDDAYLKGILKGDHKVIGEIYEKFQSGIINFVEGQGGSEDDALDIFQDAILVLYHKAKDSDFELKSSLYTYFYAICKNLWRKVRGRKMRLSKNEYKGLDLLSDDDIEREILKKERYDLYLNKFSQLKEACRQILTLVNRKKSMNEIAEEMGYSSHYAREKHYRCKESLTKLVKKDPRFQELYENF